jgi:hypothetical protein
MDFQATNYSLHLAGELLLQEQALLNNSDMPPEIQNFHNVKLTLQLRNSHI